MTPAQFREMLCNCLIRLATTEYHTPKQLAALLSTYHKLQMKNCLTTITTENYLPLKNFRSDVHD